MRKLTLKQLIGAISGALLWYSPLRKHFLRDMLNPEKKSFLLGSFRLFVLDILFYTDVPRYRSLIVSREAGDKWCDIYRSRRDTYEKQFSDWFDLLEKLILQNKLTRVMQVGCAGGGELYHVAKRMPQISFIGVDLNKTAIERNREVYKEITNIEFVHGDVFTRNFFKEYKPQLVFTSGTAEYFTEDELKAFITLARKEMITFVIFREPVTITISDYPRETRSKPRGGMAFNHNYAFHLSNLGFKVSESVYEKTSTKDVKDVIVIGRFPSRNEQLSK